MNLRTHTAQQYRHIRRILSGTEPEPDQDSLKENPDLIYSAFVVIGSILLAMALIIGLAGKAHAQEINLDIISIIESSGNNMAYNFKSGATGQYQITETALKDYNKHARENELTELNLSDMYEPKYAYMVANWYLNEHIPDLLWDYGIKDTILNRILCYNWGIGKLKKWYKKGAIYANIPRESKNYYKKYLYLQSLMKLYWVKSRRPKYRPIKKENI